MTVYSSNSDPKVIPALQKWESEKGLFNIKEKGTICISEKDKHQLEWCALQLSEDIKEMFGWEYRKALKKCYISIYWQFF